MRLNKTIIGSVAVAVMVVPLAIACSSSDDTDAQATIDAAVQATVTNQPIPDVRATVDAVVQATTQAGSDLRATAEASIDATETASSGRSPHPDKRDASYYETRLRTLIDTDDVPVALDRGDERGLVFVDLESVPNVIIDENAVSFTELTLQSKPIVPMSLQITDYETNDKASATLESEIGDNLRVTVGDKVGARFHTGKTGAVVWVNGSSILSVGYQSSELTPSEWSALEALASQIDDRFQQFE